MVTCANCNKSVSDRDASKLQCDGCRRPIHLACTELSVEDRVTRQRSKCLKIVCNCCSAAMDQFGDIKLLLESFKSEFRRELDDFKSKFNEIKNNDDTLFEEIITEVNERSKRKCNLVIFGLPEQEQNIPPSQQESAEKDDISNILHIIRPNITLHDIKPVRVGRYCEGKHRPIKIKFNSEQIVSDIVYNAKMLKTSRYNKKVSISFDRTPKQLSYYKKIKGELNTRLASGETNLKIKYVNGIPKIIALNL